MTKQNIGACAILTNSQQKILLGKRKNSYKAGYYGLPGGRIEFGEPILTAIEREVFEETGCKDLTFQFVGVVRETQEATEFIHFMFTAEVTNQEPQPLEPEKCEQWEWFAPPLDSKTVLAGHLAGISLYLSGEVLAEV